MAKSNQEKQTRKPSDCHCDEPQKSKNSTKSGSRKTSDCKNCK